jgi:phosphoglycerate kinase
MNKLTIDDISVKGKRVLTRVDFNVPIKDGNVKDDTRIRESLPTIKKVIGDGGRIILMSHLGRPKGKVAPEFSLRPVVAKLSALLGKPVKFAEDCIGPKAEAEVASLKDGEVLLLENLRFHAEEEKNDPAFSKQLASLGDLYINDAFGSAHRAHSSTEGLTKFIKPSVAGYLMQKELKYLGSALANPKRPFVAIIGGAKISGKIDVIKNLLGKVDYLLIGGGMIFTFYKAMGLNIGKSLLEEDRIAEADSLLKMKLPGNVKMILPDDILVADKLEAPFQTKIVNKNSIPDGWIGVDIGPDSQKIFGEIIAKAGTIVWNGPMGIFETDAFATGTIAMAKAIAAATEKGAVSIIGGGDSVAAIAKAGLTEKISHISTGGGASLEFLEGKVLPGVAALTDRS